jgi:hypothetical protein
MVLQERPGRIEGRLGQRTTLERLPDLWVVFPEPAIFFYQWVVRHTEYLLKLVQFLKRLKAEMERMGM